MANSFTMFAEKENEILTRTGPGTPMGDLLRCFDFIQREEYPTGLTVRDQRTRNIYLIKTGRTP